jgi:cation diffusion facilitator family transporter
VKLRSVLVLNFSAPIPLAQFRLIADNPIMSGTPALYSPNAMRAEKRAVAGNSVLAALLITGGKIVVGVTTGSLGILSEAAHSALDLIAASLTYFSVGVSDKPADADHQYGHGKVENFSAFVETGLLLLTCVWVIYEAIVRLFFRRVDVEPSVWAFAVMLISMAVDYWRSRALGRIATKYDSQALEADALHFSTDVWSAGVVVLGWFLFSAGRTYVWSGCASPIPSPLFSSRA